MQAWRRLGKRVLDLADSMILPHSRGPDLSDMEYEESKEVCLTVASETDVRSRPTTKSLGGLMLRAGLLDGLRRGPMAGVLFDGSGRIVTVEEVARIARRWGKVSDDVDEDMYVFLGEESNVDAAIRAVWTSIPRILRPCVERPSKGPKRMLDDEIADHLVANGVLVDYRTNTGREGRAKVVMRGAENQKWDLQRDRTNHMLSHVCIVATTGKLAGMDAKTAHYLNTGMGLCNIFPHVYGRLHSWGCWCNRCHPASARRPPTPLNLE